MVKNILGIKLINIYILKLFIVRFLIILFFGLFAGILIEFASKFGRFDAFNFFLNFQSIFSFIFFISSAWTVITLQKTREFIIMQVSTISVFKIFFIFLTFAFVWSLFFLSFYQGIFLKMISDKVFSGNSLKKIEIYNKLENPCNYNIFIFENIFLNEKEEVFSFQNADIFTFNDCKFQKHEITNNGVIEKRENQLFFSSEKLQFETNYDYNVFKSYFQEKIDNQKYKTFFEKFSLMKNFIKFQIDYRKLELGIMKTGQEILSFFYTIAISFLFFSKLPPRGKIFFKLFASICFMASVYMINIIISGYVEMSQILNPIFIIIPSIILFSSIILILVFKKT